MGSSVSAELLQQVQSTALVAQTPSLVVTSTPQCAKDSSTTLLVHGKQVTDAATGAVMFTSDRKTFTMHGHQSLLNTDGKQLMIMRTSGTFTIQYNFIDGDNQDVSLGSAKIDRLDDKTSFTATILNRTTKQETAVVVTGNWRARAVLIWRVVLDKDKQPIAKVLNAPKGTKGYHLTIAAGVELALIVMLCRAMELGEESDDGAAISASAAAVSVS